MTKKFEYETILIKGNQNGIFAEFPFDSAKEFGTRKPIRVEATFDGNLFFMSLLPTGKGTHWLHVKKDIRLAIGKEEGDSVKISIEKDNSPKTVQIPEYLQWLLDAYSKYPRKEEFFNPFFEKLAGTTTLRRQIEMGWNEEQIRQSWQKDLKHYLEKRKNYLIYD